MCAKLKDIIIRRAETAPDVEQLYRFRYRIYVEEMGRPQRYADHERKRIEEPLDATAVNWIALKDDRVVGCLRWNSGRDTDFGEYVDFYDMRRAGRWFPEHCGTTTKLMVDAAHRRSALPVLLCRAGYRHARSQGLLVDFMDCNPHLEAQFAAFGYRPYRSRLQHPEYGDVLPMVLVCADLDHLRRVRSPLAEIEAAHPRQPEVVRWCREHVFAASQALAPSAATSPQTQTNAA